MAPTIRDAYPPCKGEGSASEPTAEQVDALVAERMANLPRWWRRDEDRKLREAVPPALPRVVLMGRGLRRAPDERKGF